MGGDRPLCPKGELDNGSRPGRLLTFVLRVGVMSPLRLGRFRLIIMDLGCWAMICVVSACYCGFDASEAHRSCM